MNDITDGTSLITDGKVTFNSEGNNIKGSKYYSRVIHYPERGGLSGVTIGRGYDMGKRTRQEIYSDLTMAGISQEKATIISHSAGLIGSQAKEFVRVNKDKIGEITEQQQISLFKYTYRNYVIRARSVYNQKTKDMREKPDWEELQPAIRDILIDVVYQGYRGDTIMLAATTNNIDDIISLIMNSSELRRDENSRNRVKYLNESRAR
ncbi:pesticin C-terminus-like muramidase [Pectobacterium sp. PL64]|uniref:pesticin C-terminus-like muramidase n=1 Tax=Pectobacterium sp. PL64 TaxID=2738983 RepID=UPI001F0CA5AC|nr:pesticin C-terminus-like muramidase [Pectobacterium sp. PL64]UMO87627.1 pesticin C-terminus-like muramidase [Pectobacterium sp. PL64]